MADEIKGDPFRGFLEALAVAGLNINLMEDCKYDPNEDDLNYIKEDMVITTKMADLIYSKTTHRDITKELLNTYKKKNKDYGDSFAQSLDKHGLIAAIVRMDDKMNRVINLNKTDEQLVNDESVRDTLMDLANYAIMSVMWLDNKSGKESDGGSNYDIYADNLKLSVADYDGDAKNS